MAIDLTPAARVGEGIAGAEREGAETSRLGVDFRAAINDHATRIDAHGAEITGHTGQIAGHTADIAGQTRQIAGHTADIAGHTGQIAGHTADIAGQTRQIAGHTTDIAGQTTRLNAHDTRLTNLEAGRAQDRTPLSDVERNNNTAQINRLDGIRTNNLAHVTTGHPSMDTRLRTRIQQDPMVQHQSAKLQGAVTDMRQANIAGDRAGVAKAAEEAETAAKDLDAARKSIESMGVFQGGNRYTSKATIVSGTLAGAGIAGAATTGGIIAWNNKKQGDHTQ